MTEPLITAKNISVESPTRRILDHVSLEVFQGKITTIIGPNGGGKTTFLRVLLGLTPPSQGTIERIKNLKVGYMPQKLNLSPLMPLTVQRFLELSSPFPNHLLTDEIAQRLQQVGAEKLKNQQVLSLSGGEFQRVLLARALINKPTLLVLDEPAQGVDILGQNDLYQLITQIRNQENCGIVLVSHDLHVVLSASDHVLCLNTHVCCSGTPDHVQENQDYQRLFGLAHYTHHHDHCHDTQCSHGEHHD